MGRGAQAETRKPDRSATRRADRRQSGALPQERRAQQPARHRLPEPARQSRLHARATSRPCAINRWARWPARLPPWRQNAANRTARTRNSAGYGDLLAELSREQGRQAGSLAQRNELAFADRSRADQAAALEGLSGIYGVDSTLLARAMGIPADLLNVRQQASRGSGFWLRSACVGPGPGLRRSADCPAFMLRAPRTRASCIAQSEARTDESLLVDRRLHRCSRSSSSSCAGCIAACAMTKSSAPSSTTWPPATCRTCTTRSASSPITCKLNSKILRRYAFWN